ncbi:MAG: hypothetical protein ACWA5R_11160 [bacterium]
MFSLSLTEIAFITAFVVYVASSIWFLVIAFRESIWWGIACLVIPFVPLIYAVLDWHRAGKPFLIAVLALSAMAFLQFENIIELGHTAKQQAEVLFSEDIETPTLTEDSPSEGETEDRNLELSDNSIENTTDTTPDPKPSDSVAVQPRDQLIPEPVVITINGGKKDKEDPFSEIRGLTISELLTHRQTLLFKPVVLCMRESSPKAGIIIKISDTQIVLERRLSGGVVKQFAERANVTSIILPDQEGHLPARIRTACQ